VDVNWYENFFDGIVLDLWRKAVPREQTRAEADFLLTSLRLSAGAMVLDVPCGSGRHALELAARGMRMVGVDLSRDEIAEARKRAAAAGLSIEWRQADMRDLPWHAAFDGAYCFGNAFGYLDPGGMRAFVQAVARALKPGARFVLDSGMVAESVLPNLKSREWTQVDDILFLEENRYDARQSCVETTYTFVRAGEAHTRTALHWVFTVRELCDMLGDAGLIAKALHSSLAGDEYRAGARYLLLVAEKH
jgi:SAM-dependent methyltransferase